ncbi:MAG: hypothetical protein FJ087_03580 [Deltaproteobacteria bacterium]|nr:hypothetical protein [Deltaproteobacteria bacterium]
MARPFSCLVLAIAATALASPSIARSPGASADEDAALILYEAGRDAYKRGDDATAVRELERAFALAPNDFIRFYLGLSLERSGRCADAKAHLAALAGKLPPEQEDARLAAAARCALAEVDAFAQDGDCTGAAAALGGIRGRLPADLEARRLGLVGACEIRKATTLSEAGRCGEAMGLVDSIPKAVGAEVDEARARITAECQRLTAGFVPKDASQRAAFVLLKAGLKALEAGNPSLAIEKLEKALKLYDEPHIRLLAARARYAALDCAGALAHGEIAVRGLPEAKNEIETMRTWCDTFDVPEGVPQGAPLDARGRLSLMGRYRDATALRVGGFDLLASTFATWDNPRARLFLGRRLFAAGRYAEAAAMLDAAAGRLTDREAEATALAARARFAAADDNPGVPKDQVHDAWRKSSELLSSGDAKGAVAAASPYPRNPWVARVLAEAYARQGDCDAVADHVGWAARSVPPPGPNWAQSLDDTCLGVRRAERVERDRVERAGQAVAARSRSRVQRGVGYGLLAAGGACVVVAAVAGWQYGKAVSDSDDAMAAYSAATNAGAATSARASAGDARTRARTWSTVGWSVGCAAVAAATAGGVLWALADRKDRAFPVVAAPWVDPAGSGGAGLAASARF